METEEKQTKAMIIAELQTLGVEVNPGKKREELLAILNEKKGGAGVVMAQQPALHVDPKPMSDTERIMNALGGLHTAVEGISKRVNRLEQGGKEDFKLEAKTEDVQAAAVGKESIDPKIVKIVEDTLGIDFGIEVKGNQERPGFELTILVPKRLSNVPTSFRPVRDEITGQYKIDEATKRVVEEEFWPGDRRSMQLGTTASYEIIQERCNRIRSFILSWYQKMNKPTPEFKFRT